MRSRVEGTAETDGHRSGCGVDGCRPADHPPKPRLLRLPEVLTGGSTESRVPDSSDGLGHTGHPMTTAPDGTAVREPNTARESVPSVFTTLHAASVTTYHAHPEPDQCAEQRHDDGVEPQRPGEAPE